MSDNCPNCNTAATYELGDNDFACQCTYEFEIEEIIATVKQVRKEMAEERKAKGEQK